LSQLSKIVNFWMDPDNLTQNTTFVIISSNQSSTLYIWIGFILLLTSSIFASVYILALYLIATSGQHAFTESFKRIIFCIGLADIILLILSGIVAGVFVLVRHVPFWLNKSLGALVIGTWYFYSSATNFLALSRFLNVVYKNWYEQWFGLKAVELSLIFLMFYGLVWFLVFLLPDVDQIFIVDGFYWAYGDSLWSQKFMYVEFYVDMFNLACMVLTYLATYIYLKFKVSITVYTIIQ